MKYCLGVDVAAIDSMYCLMSEDGEIVFPPTKFEHTNSGFQKVVEKLGTIDHNCISVILESTSTYHLKVVRFFRENTKCDVIVLNPIISKEHKRNLRKTKTDKEDCFNLIDIFFKREYNRQTQHATIYEEMQFLSRQIEHLQEGATRTRNRLKQLISMINPTLFSAFRNDFLYGETGLKFAAEWPHCSMFLEASVDDIANSFGAIRNRSSSYYRSKAEKLKHFATDCYPAVDKTSIVSMCLSETALSLFHQQEKIECLKKKLIDLAKTIDLYDLYVTIPGIGPYLAATLLAELKDIRRFDNHKKLIAFCGLDPTIIQSGKSVHYNGPISKRGNAVARKMLFYTINVILMVARKTDPDNAILLYYEKKRGEGKHHHACVIACCTKLLRILLAMSKQNQSYT